MTPRLDDAIDLVAKQMTGVRADDALAVRILDSLPERSMWSLQWLVPRLAVLAMLVAAGMTLSLRKTTVESTPLTASAKPLMAGLHASIEAEPNRTTPLERLEPLALEPRPDHAFALPPLDPVVPLEDEALTLAPLEIGDLLLTDDFPR